MIIQVKDRGVLAILLNSSPSLARGELNSMRKGIELEYRPLSLYMYNYWQRGKLVKSSEEVQIYIIDLL